MQVGQQPDVDSDDENDTPHRMPSNLALASALKVRQRNAASSAAPVDPLHPVVKNKAFPCCIMEYGVEVEEEVPQLANAGKGKKWKRMHRLFGVSIL